MSSEAAAILDRLTQHGCRVTAHAGRLRVEAKGALPTELLQAARDHKADLLALVDTAARELGAVLGMPLDVYAQHGGPIEVAVPWWPETLWFVPDGRHAALLEAEGVSRGRLWTAGELMDLLAVRGAPNDVCLVARAKLEFAGDVIEVRPRG
jgi:hypothetical protein